MSVQLPGAPSSGGEGLLAGNKGVRNGELLVAQSCLTLCDPVDCSFPGFSVHGVLQARILEWVAIPFSNSRIEPESPTLQVDSLPSEPPGKQASG